MSERRIGKLLITEGHITVTQGEGYEHWAVNRKSLATIVANQLGIPWDGKELKLGRTRLWLERLE